MAKLRVTWKKSAIGKPERQRRTLRALGLRRLNHAVIHEDTPQILGMLHAISHLVQWEELSE